MKCPKVSWLEVRTKAKNSRTDVFTGGRGLIDLREPQNRAKWITNKILRYLYLIA